MRGSDTPHEEGWTARARAKTTKPLEVEQNTPVDCAVSTDGNTVDSTTACSESGERQKDEKKGEDMIPQ